MKSLTLLSSLHHPRVIKLPKEEEETEEETEEEKYRVEWGISCEEGSPSDRNVKWGRLAALLVQWHVLAGVHCRGH